MEGFGWSWRPTGNGEGGKAGAGRGGGCRNCRVSVAGIFLCALILLTTLTSSLLPVLFPFFPQVIELEPKNERNFYKRFRVFLSKRKYAEAILDLSRALELKPKYKQVGWV